ncbi:AI-2E family transporter [Gordonia sp. NPDC003425]
MNAAASTPDPAADGPGRPAPRSLAEYDRSRVHPFVRASAEWTWRLLILVFGVYLLGRLFLKFDEVFVPVALAILISAFLVPGVDWLNRRRWPRWLAVVLMLVIALGVVATVLTFVGRAFVNGFPDLTHEIIVTIDTTRDWLVHGPLNIDESQVQNFGSNIITLLEHNQAKVAGGALATATTATELLTGALLTLFLTIFFLYGGGQIWEFCCRVIPRGSRRQVAEAGVAGFGTLVAYVRATVIVALVDATCIGIGLAILQVPLALPLATIIFLFSFIPIVGALISGTLAVAIALVTQGWVTAVIVLAILIGVMQLEGHVLQPFLLGRSVRLHPVAVIIAIAAGIVAAGIVGGLFAVPLIAFANTAVRHLSGSHERAISSGDGSFHYAQPDDPHWDEKSIDTAVASAEKAVDEAITDDPDTSTDTSDRSGTPKSAPDE